MYQRPFLVGDRKVYLFSILCFIRKDLRDVINTSKHVAVFYETDITVKYRAFTGVLVGP